MLPTIYTTYGMAMGHQPETLANSGGLRPTGAEPRRTRTADIGLARVRGWLDDAVRRVCPRHRDKDARLAHGRLSGFRAARSLRVSWVRRLT
jgi:hypothetical protein